MSMDIEHLQRKPWHEQMELLVRAAIQIAKEYQSPFKNDAKGILECYQLDDKLVECIKILNRYKGK